MKTATKVWIIVAVLLVLLGLLVLGLAMALDNGIWNFENGGYSMREYEIDIDFSDIRIESGTADIDFVPSKDKSCKVVCHEKENLRYTVSSNNGTLEIKLVDSRKWYDYINIFSFKTPELTVYLPAGEYGALTVDGSTGDVEIPENFSFKSIDVALSTGDVECSASARGLLKIRTSTGEISLEDVKTGAVELAVTTGKVSVKSVDCAGDVTLKVSTGRATLTGVDCKNFTSSGNTGNVTLKDVIAEGKLSIERSTGDVSFDRCDAAEIYVMTDTGDVKGNLISDKEFIVETDTGSVDVPRSTEGSRCEIKTDTGDVKITVGQ